MKLLNTLIVIVVIAAGAGAVYYFLGGRQTAASAASEHGDGHDGRGESEAAYGGEEDGRAQEEEAERGPHGGRLLREDEFQLEITVFEDGVPPEFRFFPFNAQGPVPPGEVHVSALLHRLGGRTDSLTFAPRDDFLRSLQEVEEPHSFDVEVQATYDGRN